MARARLLRLARLTIANTTRSTTAIRQATARRWTSIMGRRPNNSTMGLLPRAMEATKQAAPRHTLLTITTSSTTITTTDSSNNRLLRTGKHRVLVANQRLVVSKATTKRQATIRPQVLAAKRVTKTEDKASEWKVYS